LTLTDLDKNCRQLENYSSDFDAFYRVMYITWFYKSKKLRIFDLELTFDALLVKFELVV